MKQKIKAKKRLGQNFLADRVAISKLIKVADIGNTDTVLEIGPGTGNITLELAKRSKKVIAVEKDSQLADILEKSLQDKRVKNVEVTREDIRKLHVANCRLQNYKVVGNIPFYLTAHLIRQLLENPPAGILPKDITLVIQKEVAQRICSKPPRMSLLAISVQFYAKPKIYGYISKNSFWPKPKVDSAILKIQIPKSKFQNVDKNLFFKIVKAGFSQPRKQLINNLANGLSKNREETKSWLLSKNIDPTRRAETLSLGEWLLLTN